MIAYSIHPFIVTCQIIEEVDAELAEAFGTKEGLNIQWVFPANKAKAFDEIVVEIIEDGLTFVEKDFEYYGRFVHGQKLQVQLVLYHLAMSHSYAVQMEYLNW